ncbi:MAG: hypothetical protein H6721_24850 [Sandaracinus sp.]|nr:hypothetical protein [Sandaracinus sp.]MCB9617563.1 hypothetical protein [Sandaracinus sp.]MCB9624842.1 hypothetical protein [Sandaracinus sp.]MCB9635361.1 hypothetical protein [Sandaracinus sp.]
MRIVFFASLLALVGCLDEEWVPVDASASDATSPDGGSPNACEDACDDAHCVDASCVSCTSATVADDCPSPSAPVCDADGECAAACDDAADCARFGTTPACATDGALAGSCVACDADADCADPSAPRCDGATKTCVACEGDASCARFAATPFCATTGDRMGRCVACDSDADCTDADAARCDLETNTCAPCTASPQCAGTGGNECDEGTCVQCTEATAATHCGGNSCDPVAGACTTTPRSSLGICQTCLSDTECSGDAACVPMLYDGMMHGYYCLPRPPAGGCGAATVPFRVAITDRVSRSDAPSSGYCGINEALTTCDAVRDAGETCLEGSDTCGPGGLCAFVGTAGVGSFLCSYLCSGGTECPATGNLSLCSAPPSASDDRYCGRR